VLDLTENFLTYDRTTFYRSSACSLQSSRSPVVQRSHCRNAGTSVKFASKHLLDLFKTIFYNCFFSRQTMYTHFGEKVPVTKYLVNI